MSNYDARPNSSDGDHGPQSPRPDWDALARYLVNESGPEEAAEVSRWLDTHPADRALLDRLNDVSSEPEATPVDVEAALAGVHARMNEPVEVRPKLVVERGGGLGKAAAPRRIGRVAVLGAAAAAAAFFASFIYQRSTDAPSTAPALASARTYTTGVGQRDTVQLADGSRVILGPDSKLTVPGTYGTQQRAIEFRGDAYFEVRHDPTKPFSVAVGRALIEDIGTTFAVETDAGDTTTVAVITGSVRLRANDAPAASGAVLAAGDRGSLAADGRVHAYPQSVSDDASWTQGRLVFHDASVARVIGEIHRWYGVELRVSDSTLLSRHVSTTLLDDQPIDEVLDIIRLAIGGVSVERHGDRATLSPVHGPATAR